MTTIGMRRPAVLALVVSGVLLVGCGAPGARHRPGFIAPATTTTSATPASTSTTVPTGFSTESASFVTPDDGFVLGAALGPNSECPMVECLAIRHTTDGGLTWTVLPAPIVTITTVQAENTSLPTEIHFADARNGWIWSQAGFWSTHDGGAAWDAIDLGGGSVVAMASGAGVADALLSPCAPFGGSCHQPLLLFRTPTDEDAWSELTDIPILGEGLGSLVDEGSAVFVLTSTFTQTETNEAQIVGATDGVHFQSLTQPCPTFASPGEPYSFEQLGASDPDDVVVACFGEPGAGSAPRQLYVSHDGGHTYRPFGPSFWGADGSEYVAMPTPTSAIVSGSSGASLLYRLGSPTGGWTTEVFPPSGGYPFFDLGFVDPLHGAVIYAAGSGTLYLTDDGGITWHPVAITW